jgi:hypothetical protein
VFEDILGPSCAHFSTQINTVITKFDYTAGPKLFVITEFHCIKLLRFSINVLVLDLINPSLNCNVFINDVTYFEHLQQQLPI